MSFLSKLTGRNHSNAKRVSLYNYSYFDTKSFMEHFDNFKDLLMGETTYSKLKKNIQLILNDYGVNLRLLTRRKEVVGDCEFWYAAEYDWLTETINIELQTLKYAKDKVVINEKEYLELRNGCCEVFLHEIVHYHQHYKKKFKAWYTCMTPPFVKSLKSDLDNDWLMYMLDPVEVEAYAAQAAFRHAYNIEANTFDIVNCYDRIFTILENNKVNAAYIDSIKNKFNFHFNRFLSLGL